MSEYWYRGFGLLIQSGFELPELVPASAHEGPVDLVIRKGTVPRVHRGATLNEEVAINKLGAAFLIRNGCEVIVDVFPHADPATLRVLLLGRIMAFLFRQRGWLPLHASGVVVNNDCVLFLGVAHAGKSTTAAAFHKGGHVVVTDDVAPVRLTGERRCIMQSAWSYVRLRDDSRILLNEPAAGTQAGKHRYDLNKGIGPGRLYPVRCAYALEYADWIGAEPIDPVRAVPLLSQYSFVRHGRMTREALEAHVRDCSSVACVLPVRRLVRPRSFSRLPDLVRLVEADLKKLETPPAYTQALPVAPA